MFALRRIAVRALQYQPTRQISTLRPVSLTSRIESSKPSFYRSFHQSQKWLAEEEQQKTQEGSAEPTVTVEPSTEEQKEITEKSIASSEVADAASDSALPQSATQATEEVKNVASSAKDALSGAAENVVNMVRPSSRFQFPNEPGKDTVLYVGNLFFEVTAQELEAEFGRFGEVVNSRIVKDPTGSSRGFGFIELSTTEAAMNAIRGLDQKVFQGRRMLVQKHVRKDKPKSPGGSYAPRDRDAPRDRAPASPSKTLFIGNMSYEMSDRDLNSEYHCGNAALIQDASSLMKCAQICLERSRTY